MTQRIIRIALALAGCILSTAGCIQNGGLDTDGTPIRFAAGSTLLRNDATKAVPKNTFASGNCFLVYGRHNTDPSLVFTAREVVLGASAWSYSDPEYWQWTGNSSDYYDFLALYLGEADQSRQLPTPSCVPAQSPFSASVTYDPTVDQYDLMLAGERRNYAEGNGVVEMEFQHMLCAVRVKVTNGSSDTYFILNGYHFENLVSSGTATVSASYDAGDNPTLAWSSLSRTAIHFGGEADLVQNLSGGNYYLNALAYDLMIPQDHTAKLGSDGWPAIVVNYTNQAGQAKSARALLKDIPRRNSLLNIERWERGVVYDYEIELNLDGGILVNVTTTPWTRIEGETPGLQLPEIDLG